MANELPVPDPSVGTGKRRCLPGDDKKRLVLVVDDLAHVGCTATLEEESQFVEDYFGAVRMLVKYLSKT